VAEERDDSQRTEEPTQRRLDEAQKKGDVVKSQELATFVMTAGGALALALFTAVAAYFFHDFWHNPPGAEHTDNMIHFMKNVSIIGGFLILTGAGAGRYSLDGPCIRPEYLKR